ncbi:DUF7779 domain-containing protein [Planomonospora algeriensis]
MVFDNALEVETVRRWCPSTGATRVIITSRNHAFTRAYHLVEVHAFTPRQATAFLAGYTGIRDDDDGAAEVAAELGCLPLALAQAAAVITRRRITYAAYLDLLRAFPLQRYLPRLDGDPYPTGTAQAILLSITQAEESTPEIRDLLEVLAVLSPAGIPRTILYGRAVDGSAPDTATIDVTDETLADLAEASLISFSEDGTSVLMHRLIQRVLRERAPTRTASSKPWRQPTVCWAPTTPSSRTGSRPGGPGGGGGAARADQHGVCPRLPHRRSDPRSP